MVFGNRIMRFLIIISAVILIDLFYFGIAKPANNTQIIIDENLKPGMPLKDAIELLGPPERTQVTKIGTIVMPYDTLGLSIEVMSDGTIIEGIHIQSSFQGRFASGLEIGADIQKILSIDNRPDIITKGIIEYFDMARIFHIDEGKLVGADLYSGESILYRQVSNKKTGKYEDKETVMYEDKETLVYEDRETVVYEEVYGEGASVFDLYGFKVKNVREEVVITEIRPESVAEYGGLKVGEPIRKAFYEGYGVHNIYSVPGLENILKKR